VQFEPVLRSVLFGDDPQHRRTPRRETARAIPLGNTGLVAVVVGDRHRYVTK
jgi:hypothetical protein